MICKRQSSFRLLGNLSAQVVLLFTLSALAQAEEPWQPGGESGHDGVTLERRAVPGSKFYEYRASAATSAGPDAVLSGIWTGVTEQLPVTVKQRKVLNQSKAELVFYDQIKTPVVSDRDYTIRMWWQRNEQTGVIEVPFTTRNELGPPPAPGHVRVPTIQGKWIITPVHAEHAAAATGTQLTYLCYSDPGGSIPAFMARGAQKDQALMDIRRILIRAQKAPAAATAR